MTRPRLLLADDHRIVAQGLKSLLENEFDLVGLVEDGQALVEAARSLTPDLIVADLTMPVLNGIDALETLRQQGLAIPFVFLTMHAHAGYARRALQAGAAGYVLKVAAPEELVQAIHAALSGGTFVSPALARAVYAADGQAAADPDSRIARLTRHQREIVRLLADGLSAKEIARRLEISARTVESHKYQIMEALGATSTAELIRLAIRHGIVDL